jgi:hypothetical protein
MDERVTVPQAARLLGISEGAVRQRIQRGTLRSERNDQGHVYVVISRDNDEQTSEKTASESRLVETLERQNEFLQRQLEAEREANRENRRLLAAALERIPEIEAPREPRESPQTGTESRSSTAPPPEQQKPTSREEAPLTEEEPEGRSWWRRVFIGE